MQELINRTSEITESAYTSALSAMHLATCLGFGYMLLSVLTSFVTKLVPAEEQAAE